jgi:hypothetical protein
MRECERGPSALTVGTKKPLEKSTIDANARTTTLTFTMSQYKAASFLWYQPKAIGQEKSQPTSFSV